LGGKCAKCGFDDYRALQIDHINGDGYKERKSKGVGQKYIGNCNTVKKVCKGELKNYQLLCANCNWIKRYENNEHRGNNVNILNLSEEPNLLSLIKKGDD